MSTSNSYNFSATRATIIKTALRKCGALGDWEEPTAEQTSVGTTALNMLIKAWSADGMPLWVIKELSIPCSSLSTGTVNVGSGQTVDSPKPLKVLQAFLRRGSLSIPLQYWDRQNFNMLTNHSITGQPNIVTYQPVTNYGVLQCYPKPDTAAQSEASIVIYYQAMFEDMDSDANELAFPAEWIEAVTYGLAVRLAPEYGLSINERQQLKIEAKEIKDLALGFGTEEGSLFIQPQ